MCEDLPKGEECWKEMNEGGGNFVQAVEHEGVPVDNHCPQQRPVSQGVHNTEQVPLVRHSPRKSTYSTA